MCSLFLARVVLKGSALSRGGRMKVTVLLRNDHEMLRGMFDQFNKPTSSRGQNGRKDLFNEIRREILIHSQMEHEIFYPALTETSSTRATELISQAEQEH